MVFASVATVLGVACRHRPMTGRTVQERAMKICPCHHGPLELIRPQGLLPVGMATSHCSVGAAVDAVVAMVAVCQGARLPFLATFAAFFLFSSSLPFSLSLFHSIFLTKAIRLDRFLVPFFFSSSFFLFHLASCIVTGQARGAGSFKGTEQSG